LIAVREVAAELVNAGHTGFAVGPVVDWNERNPVAVGVVVQNLQFPELGKSGCASGSSQTDLKEQLEQHCTFAAVASVAA
jgi:hypothetical protein